MRLVIVLLIWAVRIASRRIEASDEDDVETSEELEGRSVLSAGTDRCSFSFSLGLRR